MISNNGLADGLRKIGARVRELTIDSGSSPSTPLGYRIRGATSYGPPSNGSWRAGDQVPDRTGVVWLCTSDGSPGRWMPTSVKSLAGPTYNVSSAQFPAWRSALTRVLSGTGNAVLMCMGDSTTEGDTLSNFPATYPSYLTGLLNQFVAPAAQTWTFAHDTPTGYDTRVSVGSNWTSATLYTTAYWLNSSVQDTWSYQPSNGGNGPAVVDTFTVYYSSVTGHGHFNINVNGGSTLATVNTGVGASPSIASATVTFTATANPTINIVGPTDGLPIVILGANAYLSTSKVIQVGNCGLGGSRAQDWANTSVGYYPGNWPGVITPDLSIIDLGINDAPSYSAAQYAANMQTIIGNWKAHGGDVLLKSFVPSSSAVGHLATENSYIPQLYALAASNNIGLLDVNTRWTSFAVSNPLGYYYTDGIHPTATGTADIARACANVLGAL